MYQSPVGRGARRGVGPVVPKLLLIWAGDIDRLRASGHGVSNEEGHLIPFQQQGGPSRV